MKALVLTYDRNHLYAANMIASYERFWPDHPFEFCIPYQNGIHESLRSLSSPIRFIHSGADIMETVMTLLDIVDQDEWVYWAIDDKYAVDLDADVARRCYDYLASQSCSKLSGLSFARARGLNRRKNLMTSDTLSICGEKFIRRLTYHQIWLHQFLRAHVLKSMFESFPSHIPTAKSMDSMKDALVLPDDIQLYVIKDNAVVFGESTTRGKVTRNCARDMDSRLKYQNEQFSSVADREIYIGTINVYHRIRRKFQYVFNLA